MLLHRRIEANRQAEAQLPVQLRDGGSVNDIDSVRIHQQRLSVGV